MAGLEQSSAYDFTGLHKDGHEITLHARADTIEWQGGTALLMTAVDITERVAAEAAARREEKRAKDYLDIAGSIFYATDQKLNLTMLNDAGCKLLECDGVQVDGRNVVDLFIPEENRAIAREQNAAWLAGRPPPASFVARMKTLRGATIYVRWQLVPIKDDSGAIVGILGSGQDISQQREIEAQLRQAQKMQAVGQLTSGIAHDFNNILMVIMGNLELAFDRIDAAKDPRKLLRAAFQSAQKGADLNRQLLTFSRQEDIHQKVVDVNQVIRDMAGLLKRALGEEVAIRTELSPSPCFAKLDPAQLESAILNLALNARDATQEAGEIIVETRCSNGCESLDVVVQDSGVGMSSAVRERAVEPFLRPRKPGRAAA